MKDDLQCPYCGADNEVCLDDGYGYAEDQLHQMECSKCLKVFVFETSIMFYYKAKPADCLNTGIHNWQMTNTYPKEYSRLRCVDCGEEAT